MESIENTFDIKDTWLFMGLLAQREESDLTKYIQRLRRKDQLSSQETAAAEYASEMRSTLRETKEICSKKALQEKNGQYEMETLNKLLNWGVISKEELEVMELRVNCTYREVAKELGIATSTAYNTVERVHERVKMLYKQISKISTQDTTKLEANAKKIKDKILQTKLSSQQAEIYNLMCQGYSNEAIAKKLETSLGNVKKQKSLVNKQKKYLNMV